MRLEVEFTEQARSHLASWLCGARKTHLIPPAVATPGISPVTCRSLPGKQCLLRFGSVLHASRSEQGYLINDCLLCCLCPLDLPVTAVYPTHFFPVKNFVYAGKFP